MTNAQMQWHPAVHEEWAGERLVFWRLGFYPTYRRREVLQALDIICDRHGITALTVYEVFGNYDLLLRLWLPKSVVTEHVDRDIKRTLAAFHLELCDSFEVETIIRHWFWSDDDEPVERPPVNLQELDGGGRGPGFDLPELDPVPSNRELCRVNELVEAFNKGRVDQEAIFSDPLASSYLQRRLIGLRNAEEGIKFTMVVSASGVTASKYEAMEDLEDRLTLILDQAGSIRERSLYSGMGFGRFMVFGKIPTEDFYEINRCLIEPITVQAGLARVYRTRSETYIGSNPRLQRFSELLSLSSEDEVAEEIDVAEVLRQGESARIEFKGSTFTNVERWLNNGEREEDGVAFEAFATAIVALLNGNGGVVVSGVLEQSSRDYESHSKLAGMPRVDGLIVLGLGFDMAGWKRQDADEFINKVRQKLETTIEPNPLDHLAIRAYPVGDQLVCAVTVQENPPFWFYLREGPDYRFVVRRDASSATISGPEEDSYKRLHSRAP